jgi:DNA-binding GntR family transcriptional regulator
MPNEPFRAEYLRIVDDLTARIRSGELAPGTKLPTKRQLADHYDVGTTTIDVVMALLRNEGWVRGHQGRGVFVADPLP